MTPKGTRLTAPPALDEGITIHNRLHAGHPYREAIDEVFRVSLRGLAGPWDLSVYAVGKAWFRIDVAAPDGASWSASVPVHEGPTPEDLAETVRAACLRHSHRRSATGKREARNAKDGRDRRSTSKTPEAAEAATRSSKDAVGGTLK